LVDLRLEWSKAARADLLAILDYISDDNPDAAERLIAEIETKASRLPERPELYRPTQPAPTRPTGRSATPSETDEIAPGMEWDGALTLQL
jgi:plasmid stabilization system protein ParE